MSVSIEEPAAGAGAGGREDSSSGEEVLVGHTKDLHDPTASKVVRVLTVLAYLLSVSFAAILLSVYYVFVWNPDPPRNPASHAWNGSNIGTSMLQAFASSAESGDPPMKEPAASSGSQLQPPGPPPAGDTFTSAPHAPDFNTAAAATATRTGSQPTLNTDRDVNQTKKFSEGRLNVITPKTS